MPHAPRGRGDLRVRLPPGGGSNGSGDGRSGDGGVIAAAGCDGGVGGGKDEIVSGAVAVEMEFHAHFVVVVERPATGAASEMSAPVT